MIDEIVYNEIGGEKYPRIIEERAGYNKNWIKTGGMKVF